MTKTIMMFIGFLLVLPILPWLPIGVSLKGKIIIVLESLAVAGAVTAALAYLPLWQGLLIGLLFFITTGYFTIKYGLPVWAEEAEAFEGAAENEDIGERAEKRSSRSLFRKKEAAETAEHIQHQKKEADGESSFLLKQEAESQAAESESREMLLAADDQKAAPEELDDQAAFEFEKEALEERIGSGETDDHQASEEGKWQSGLDGDLEELDFSFSSEDDEEQKEAGPDIEETGGWLEEINAGDETAAAKLAEEAGLDELLGKDEDEEIEILDHEEISLFDDKEIEESEEDSLEELEELSGQYLNDLFEDELQESTGISAEENLETAEEPEEGLFIQQEEDDFEQEAFLSAEEDTDNESGQAAEEVEEAEEAVEELQESTGISAEENLETAEEPEEVLFIQPEEADLEQETLLSAEEEAINAALPEESEEPGQFSAEESMEEKPRLSPEWLHAIVQEITVKQQVLSYTDAEQIMFGYLKAPLHDRDYYVIARMLLAFYMAKNKPGQAAQLADELLCRLGAYPVLADEIKSIKEIILNQSMETGERNEEKQ
ncbi:putative sodium/potassium/calcium exchanger [Domibacillus indicus]|uniref:hypothetical protein n=1 Tax=Domibacillus indicus TaxID=1437523 RepID=UPI000617FEA5|nr:hypothetical protein [Domibacillus indicus]